MEDIENELVIGKKDFDSLERKKQHNRVEKQDQKTSTF